MATLVPAALEQLDGWITRNGWAGYDPYDIRGQDWFVRLFGCQTYLHRKIRGALALAESHLPPLALRKALRIRREINPKGMGLLASAYLVRYQTTGQQRDLARAEAVLGWLAAHGGSDYPGVSWGYPFHWQSRIFIPRGTPSVVVTGTVGNAWLDHHELTQSPASLEMARRVAVFMLEGLNRYEKSTDEICFSYTPIDNYRVHNANLFAAAFLARLSAITGDDQARSLSIRAARYTVGEQNADGSFYYWGSEPPTTIDHYHTGFVLRHLHTIWRTTGSDFVEEPLRKGYAFYVDRLFTAGGVPKYSPDSIYPIDVHSCSEAILCILQLGGTFGRLDLLEPVTRFAVSKMQTAEGFFIAQIRKRWWGEQRVRVPYLRWAQAWMLLALSRLEAKRTQAVSD